MALACDCEIRRALYRLTRLRAARVVDRSRRLYAEVGSPPWHWWLTTRGTRLAGGTGRVRPGEDRGPNFLEHTAATAAVPITLTAHGPAAGLHLDGWLRDEQAWENYRPTTYGMFVGSTQRIRPDGLATISLDPTGQPLPVFVEVDRATAATGKLCGKVRRYLDYADSRDWADRHRICPALLLLTTKPGRAEAFLAAVAAYRSKSTGASRTMTVAVAAAVHDPHKAVSEPVWRTEPSGAPTTLRQVLTAHLAAAEADRRAREEQRRWQQELDRRRERAW